MKKCNNCKSINKDKDKYCRHCGYVIRTNLYYIIRNIITIFAILLFIFLIALFIASYYV